MGRAAAASAAARAAASARASVRRRSAGPWSQGAPRGHPYGRAAAAEPRSRATATRSCRRWRSAQTASGARVRARTYPALQQLEDEGLIRAQELDGRKLFQLTDAGREYVKERGEDKPAPWEQMSGDVSEQAHELGRLIREVASAFMQVVRTGSEAQMGEARKVLTTTRKDLYRILADGDPGEGDTEAGIVGEDA